MIGIVDYGMGNLGSVQNACAYLQLPASIIRQPSGQDACTALIVPGVGAFGDCMEHLRGHGFVEPLRRWVAARKPMLGICVGLQVLFESSEESPGVAGLGVLPGRVRRFSPGQGRKVPQIGWNRVRQQRKDCPLFTGIPDGSFFYFVHSYFVEVADQAAQAVVGETEFGVRYASAVWRDRLVAVQFHPEKSHEAGLRMLMNFARWAGVRRGDHA